jgi:hypothetical protein
MAGVRALLDRVRKLEQARVSPWARLIGTPEDFAAKAQAGIDAGTYDRLDMPSVVASVLRWVREGDQCGVNGLS